MWVPHEDLLLGLKAHTIELDRVLTATACAVRATEAIVGKALAVELEAARFAAIARLETLLLAQGRGIVLMIESAVRLGSKSLLEIGHGSHIVHNRIIAMHLERLLERLINALVQMSVLGVALASMIVTLTLKLLQALIRHDCFVERGCVGAFVE